jgi:prephenate dehydratase
MFKQFERSSAMLDKLALALVIVGALNWGGIGIFQYDLVAMLFGGSAAIGSRMAAELYGLDILSANIQDKADNTTRFAVIGRQKNAPSGNDRTTVCFSVPHTAGGLVNVLNIFRDHGVNIWCMDSRPTRDTAWEYLFYIDVEGHEEVEPLRSCLKQVHDTTPMFKVLGSYPET